MSIWSCKHPFRCPLRPRYLPGRAVGATQVPTAVMLRSYYCKMPPEGACQPEKGSKRSNEFVTRKPRDGCDVSDGAGHEPCNLPGTMFSTHLLPRRRLITGPSSSRPHPAETCTEMETGSQLGSPKDRGGDGRGEQANDGGATQRRWCGVLVVACPSAARGLAEVSK